jgi:hypothetical protein
MLLKFVFSLNFIRGIFIVTTHTIWFLLKLLILVIVGFLHIMNIMYNFHKEYNNLKKKLTISCQDLIPLMTHGCGSKH